ncbi:unnamed protein product [Cunninghamella echinulata]
MLRFTNKPLQRMNEAAANKLQLGFKTPGILEQALTHCSYLHGNTANNDRLQILGAQVVQLTIADAGVKLLGINAEKNELNNYVKKYTNPTQLAEQFDTLGLNEGLRYTAGTDSVPSGIKAKAFESLVGAICHDKGTKAAQEFVSTHLLK